MTESENSVTIELTAKEEDDAEKFMKFFSKLDRRKKRREKAARARKVLKVISNVILWLCAVGGFALGVLQAISDC